MPKFLIEREVPGVGKLSPYDLQAMAHKSCGILQSTGLKTQWLQNYVADDTEAEPCTD